MTGKDEVGAEVRPYFIATPFFHAYHRGDDADPELKRSRSFEDFRHILHQHADEFGARALGACVAEGMEPAMIDDHYVMAFGDWGDQSYIVLYRPRPESMFVWDMIDQEWLPEWNITGK
jgi:hypothetical protein